MAMKNPTDREIDEGIRLFEDAARVSLHRVASGALRSLGGELSPVPSLVKHDGYMLGRLYVASSPRDGRASFIAVSFVVARNSSLVVLHGDDAESLTRSLHATVENLAKSSTSGADVALGLLNISMQQLDDHLRDVNQQVRELREGISNLSSERQGSALRQLVYLGEVARVAEAELLSVFSLVDGLAAVGRRIASDELDLHDDSGIELFGPSDEITAAEIEVKGTELLLVAQNLLRRLEAASKDLQLGHSELRHRANRRMMAVVALAVSPYLLLNIYTQFFAEGEIWSNSFTTRYSWIIIVAIESGLLAYIYRRKWLR
jgi:Mg2+ and Co2+ transporter CorA